MNPNLKTYLIFVLILISSKEITAQAIDTLLIKDNKTLDKIILFKSTIQDAVNKFSNYTKVDTALSHISSIYFMGSGCETIIYKKRIFYFQNNSIIIETTEKSDTINKIIVSSPIPLKTMDNVVLGKTTLDNLIEYTGKNPLIYSNSLNGKNYSYIKYNNVYYGINSSFTKVRPRHRKMIITQIMIAKK